VSKSSSVVRSKIRIRYGWACSGLSPLPISVWSAIAVGSRAGRKLAIGPAARIEVHLRTKSSPENDS
jgi:hypothetical protein